MSRLIFNQWKTILGSVLPICMVLLAFSGEIKAQTQDENCEQRLNQAEQRYNTGLFDEAEKLIEDCLQTGNMDREQKLRAYRLLGLTYIAKDFEKEARDAVTKLLEMVPNYKPDPVQDPPPFRTLVEEVREQEQQQQTQTQTAQAQQDQTGGDLEQIVQDEQQQQKKKKRLLYTIGGAVVGVAVIATVIVLGGGGGEGGFPMPPGRP